MKSKRFIIIACLFLLIITIKNVNAEDKGLPIQPDCSGKVFKVDSKNKDDNSLKYNNGIKATYNLGSTALVKMTLATYYDSNLNVIGYYYYADDKNGHYSRFVSNNQYGGNVKGGGVACGFVTNNGYNTGCEDISNKIEIVKSVDGLWFLNEYNYHDSFGLLFSASKASAYFSQVENMQKVINTIATGTEYYVDLNNITTENVELINNMILIVEPVYSFSVTMENHSRENWPYIFTTIKGVAGLLNENSSVEKHRYSAGINIDDLAINVYALNKYGVINKNNANALIQFDGINVYAAKYAYLASHDNGLGYGIYSMKEIIPKIVKPPVDPVPDFEEYVKCPLDVKSTIPSNCEEGTSGSIREPSVCALITSANNNSKYNINTYSISDITRLTEQGGDGGTVFGRNIATVYCQDSGNYDFYGLTSAYSGRYFEYDVTGQGNYFASYSGEKKCLSIINYSAWKEIYDIALENARIRYNIWQKWLSLQNGTMSSIKDKSCSGSTCLGGCTGVGGYSYYWSGSYNYVNPSGTLTRKKAVYSSTSTKYPSCSTPGSCQDYEDVTGEDGSTTRKYGNPYCCGGGCSDGSSGNPNVVSNNVISALNAYNTAKNRVIELENQLLKANYIDNGNNSFSNEISNYHTVTESKSISYNSNMDKLVDVGISQNNTTKSVKYSSANVLPCLTPTQNNYKALCNNEPNVTGDSTSSLYRDSLKTKIGITSINIPTNRFAYAISSDSEKYYQKNQIYTQIFTGIMSNEARGDNWIKLKEKVFPLELKSNNYNETLTFNYSSYTQYNNQKNLKQSGTYSCDIIVKPSLVITSDDKKSTQLGYVYRSVDLLDLFPNAKDPSLESYRMPGYNWWDEYEGFVKLKNDIEAMEKQQNVLAKTPQYTVVLTPELVDEIKKYNNGRGYSDNSIECKIGGSTNSQYVCQSKFLNSKYFDSNTFVYNSNNDIRNVFAKDMYNNFYYYQGAVN